MPYAGEATRCRAIGIAGYAPYRRGGRRSVLCALERISSRAVTRLVGADLGVLEGEDAEIGYGGELHVGVGAFLGSGRDRVMQGSILGLALRSRSGPRTPLRDLAGAHVLLLDLLIEFHTRRAH